MAHGDWWRHGVIYHIYPRSFADANGDGVGDLAGITSRLDYLNDGTPDSLGVDAIWLSPFYPSPMRDFGYDVADYTGVDPLFGTLEDFDTLAAEAHARGIRVIVDLVPNHTSDQHPWFVESRSSRVAPKRDWYVWADSRAGDQPPNNWMSAFPRAGRAWTFEPSTGQWYLHSFLAAQPDLNWWSPRVRDAMDDVMRFWLDRGVDGFRIDVAHRMAKDPELRDNPLIDVDEDDPTGIARAQRLARTGVELYDEDWPEVHEILRRFRRTLDGYDDRMAVGEVYLLDLRKLARYYGTGRDELHLAHNFVFLHQPWKPEAFRSVVDEYGGLLPADAWPAQFLGNHDHPRVASRYDEGGNGQARARVGAMMILTLRGTPFVYYGEELGMSGPKPDEQIRTPYPWTAAAPGYGFTTGTPWEPFGGDAATSNAASESGDPDSLLTAYSTLIQFRRDHPALATAPFVRLDSSNPRIAASVRSDGAQTLLVIQNLGAEPASDVALTLRSGPLCGSPGAAVAYPPALTDAPVAVPTVTANGGLEGYVPLATIPGSSTIVLSLDPRGTAIP